MRLPKLKKDKNIFIQSKHAVRNIDNIGALLTCLSIEARKNNLISMSLVLTELANELCDSTSPIENLIYWAEKQKENNE